MSAYSLDEPTKPGRYLVACLNKQNKEYFVSYETLSTNGGWCQETRFGINLLAGGEHIRRIAWQKVSFPKTVIWDANIDQKENKPAPIPTIDLE